MILQMDNFSTRLRAYKDSMKITQLEMCSMLFDVPHRTLQSWLQGEKLPPDYVKSLILNRMDDIYSKLSMTKYKSLSKNKDELS